MDPTTFFYLSPTDEQAEKMGDVREAFAELAAKLDTVIPEGADKTYLLRKLREVAMWANTAITREADGTPRDN
jgi:hypothetical protein